MTIADLFRSLHLYLHLTWYAGRGVSPFNATLRVSQLLGHKRAEVTNGYLVSVPKGGSAHA